MSLAVQALPLGVWNDHDSHAFIRPGDAGNRAYGTRRRLDVEYAKHRVTQTARFLVALKSNLELMS